MDMRVASGMARYGLPGLVLGIALCWGAGMRGPEAAAQTDRGGGQGQPRRRRARRGHPKGAELNRHGKARWEKQTELLP